VPSKVRSLAAIDSDTALPHRSGIVNADINIRSADEIRILATANTTNTAASQCQLPPRIQSPEFRGILWEALHAR